MNHYNLNLTTGKIELHFEKSTYQTLPQETKNEIKRAFLWSSFAGAWVSRAKHPGTYRAEQLAKELKLNRAADTGERLSFAEQVERDQDRAARKAERFSELASKNEEVSASAFDRSDKLADVIPLGQPILIGHHSEKRHRRHMEKIDNAMRKGVEASNKADYYQYRANTAERAASGIEFSNPVYLNNRIEECEASLRGLNRRLQTAGPEYTEQLENAIKTETEKLTFFKEKFSQLNTYDREKLMAMQATYVKYRRQWYPVKSYNAKTVTMLNWSGIAHWTWKPAYADIQDASTNALALDRDGHEVKPQVKF